MHPKWPCKVTGRKSGLCRTMNSGFPRGPPISISVRRRWGRTREQTAAAVLYTALLMDELNEFAYPARLAGLSFSFYKHAQGISLRMSGYNDKQTCVAAAVARRYCQACI